MCYNRNQTVQHWMFKAGSRKRTRFFVVLNMNTVALANGTPKIALAMIVKDDSEYESLDRALASAAPFVDRIFLTVTNEPQKKIKELAKRYNAQVNFFEWCKDFSKARNFCFSQVSDKYDWLFWMDCDDVLMGGEKLKEAAMLADQNNVKQVFARYLYQVELDELGKIKNILIEHLRERLIKNDGHCEWVAPIHETLIEKYPVSKTDYMGFQVVHLTTYDDMVNSMWRNIDILEEEVLRNWSDPRPIYYLAKAYFDTKDPELVKAPIGDGLESITLELFKEYQRKSGWAEERAQCWEYIAMLKREQGDYQSSIAALLEALHEAPVFPSIYIQLALTYVVLGDWSKALHWVKIATNMEIPKTTLVINPKDYKTMILEALFYIYLNTGQLEKCHKVATDMLAMLPTELNKHRFAEIDDVKGRNDLAHWTVKLANHLYNTNQVDQLRALINSIPREIANEPVLMNLRNQFLPPRTWEDDEVAIFCGPGFEQWSPKSIAKGIGGSEEAVIYQARELVKLGWKVTVFADPREDEGVHDGVNYLPYYHINWKDNFNIFISWRQIGLFDQDIRAKKTYLWNHDIQNPLEYKAERVKKIDKVMFLSKWHRQNVPALPEEKVMYTSNGINI